MNQTPVAYALAAGVIIFCILSVSRGTRVHEHCAPARRLDSGACCPPWHYASESDGCLLRPWNRLTEEEGNGYDVAAVSAAVTSDGRVALAWEQVTGPLQTDVRVAEERGDGGWHAIKPAHALQGQAQQCALAAGPDGSLAVAWRQQSAPGSAIMHAQRTADGSWSLPAVAEHSLSLRPDAYRPTVAFAGSEVMVGWGQQGPNRVRATVAWPGSEPVLLSPAMFFANDVLAATNGSGDAIISWYQSVGAALHVFVSERRRGGGWTHPAADEHLSPAHHAPEGKRGRYLGESRPAIAASGAAAVVWAQPDLQGDVRLMLATRSADGVWRKPREPGDTFSSGAGVVTQPSIAFTSSGDLYLVWRHVHGGEQAIYLAHRLADGRWLASGIDPQQLSAAGAEVIEPVLAVGADGGVIVAWSERRGKAPWSVTARRSSSHARGWERERWSPAARLSPPGGDALRLTAAIGGADDRALVAWIQQRRVLYATVD